MNRDEFEKLVAEEFPHAIPEKFRDKIKNVAFLIEDEPSEQTRIAEKLGPHETLLGLYRGVPHTARGDYYGVGGTLPDTITLFQRPIENDAQFKLHDQQALQESALGRLATSNSPENPVGHYIALVRQVIRDTIWHEVAHHFGMDEGMVRSRERTRGVR